MYYIGTINDCYDLIKILSTLETEFYQMLLWHVCMYVCISHSVMSSSLPSHEL